MRGYGMKSQKLFKNKSKAKASKNSCDQHEDMAQKPLESSGFVSHRLPNADTQAQIGILWDTSHLFALLVALQFLENLSSLWGALAMKRGIPKTEWEGGTFQNKKQRDKIVSSQVVIWVYKDLFPFWETIF